MGYRVHWLGIIGEKLFHLEKKLGRGQRRVQFWIYSISSSCGKLKQKVNSRTYRSNPKRISSAENVDSHHQTENTHGSTSQRV